MTSVHPINNEADQNKYISVFNQYDDDHELAQKRAENVEDLETRRGIDDFAEIEEDTSPQEYSFSDKCSIWFAKGFCCGKFCSKREYKIVNEYERLVVLRFGKLVPEGAQGPGLFYTLKGIDSARIVDCREHVRLLDYQVGLTKNALPLAVQPVLCYSFYSPIKACLDARDPEEMLKEFTESIVKKTIASHTAVEFINQKKKLQIFIRDDLIRSIQRWGVRVNRVEFHSIRLANKSELMQNRIVGFYYK